MLTILVPKVCELAHLMFVNVTQVRLYYVWWYTSVCNMLFFLFVETNVD